MPRFEPFRGIRYATDRADLAQVTAPPYDVLSDADRAAHAAKDPHNVVVVDVPLESDGPGRYDAAARTFSAWLDDGVLVTDPEPAYYLYRLTFTDEAGSPQRTTGVLGGLEVTADGGDVLPHEQTTPKARTDRLDLTRATGVNLSPVWGLSLAEGLGPLVDEPAEVLAEFSADGIVHRLERVADPARVEALRAAVEAAPVVVADGHHRYDVARTFRQECHDIHGGAGPWDLTLTFVVPLVEDALHVQAIHRLVTVEDPAALDAALDAAFERAPYGPVDPTAASAVVARGGLLLVRPDGQGDLLVPRPGAFTGVADLDAARLAHALRALPHEVRYQHGVEHVLAALAGGEATVGILLRPVTVADIEATAAHRTLMPPKSTFFAPKPRTGLVFRRAR